MLILLCDVVEYNAAEVLQRRSRFTGTQADLLRFLLFRC